MPHVGHHDFPHARWRYEVRAERSRRVSEPHTSWGRCHHPAQRDR